MTIDVYRLLPTDVYRYVIFRKQMLEDAPWAFSATVEDDRALNAEGLTRSLDNPEFAILAIESPEVPDSFAAVAGVYRMKSAKFAHRANLWGVFVDAKYRNRGYGRVITAAAVELARRWKGVASIDLSVSANSSGALSLYTDLGFVEWGREPEATQINGQRFDEIHMALKIESAT